MDLNDIMRMIKDPQAIQAQADQLRAKAEAIEVVGSSGGGMVKITLSGGFEMKSCVIAPEIIDPADPVMLQDLVRAAHNDAMTKVKEALGRELSFGLGDMGLPMGFPPFNGGGLA